MKTKFKYYQIILGAALLFSGCTSFKDSVREAQTEIPETYIQSSDSVNIADMNWREYFKDENLIALIDTALHNNQELNIMLQEIAISQYEVLARKGEYLPSVNVGVGLGMEKEGRYTRHGAVDEQLHIREGHEFPDPLGDFEIGAYGSWEVDIWRKLRNAKDAAATRYLASVEGNKFMVTNLVAEIAETYYELMAYDNLLQTINQNVDIQSNALRIVKLQKESAKVSQLAVNRFEAQLLKTTNLQYEIKQRIVEAENRLNYLSARYPQSITRGSAAFLDIPLDSLQVGVPAQLLANRPDLRQAELELAASKLDVKIAKANFYPSLDIRAGVGLNAYNPKFLINPYSILFNLAGDMVAPLINKNGIKAAYYTANAQQLQAVFHYEQAILKAHVDVMNQLARIENYSKSFEVKSSEVELLNQSVNIASNLFNSARADYVEVLLTQEETLEAKLELIEVKGKLLQSKVNLYRALGGGWK
jgi:multidrug efflux system outer membrane protein